MSQKASSATYKDGRGLVGVKQLFWWRDVADKPISSRPCADVALVMLQNVGTLARLNHNKGVISNLAGVERGFYTF